MGHGRGPQIAANTYAFAIVTTIATALRIWCRARVLKVFALDDWLAVAAQILFIIFCTYEILGVGYGTGQHIADIPEGNVHKAMQMWWTCEPTYVLTGMFIKGSIGVFLLRICVERIHRIILWTVLIVTQVYGLFFFLLFVLQCRPTQLFWLRYTPTPPDGSCLDAQVVAKAFYAYSAVNCWCDWTYSLLPFFFVRRLQMNLRTKISVIVILAAGVIASSATIVRFPFLHTLTDIDDFLYSTADVAIWSTVETGIGITAAAAATLRPLLRSFFGSNGSTPGAGTATRNYFESGNKVQEGDDTFALHERRGQGLGVTTVIDHDKNMSEDSVDDAEQRHNRGDHGSEGSSAGAELEEYDNSGRANEQRGWNITVKKSIMQTTGHEIV